MPTTPPQPQQPLTPATTRLEAGRELVERAMPPHLPILERLIPAAQRRAQQHRTAYLQCSASCGVTYNDGSVEVVTWHICLLLTQHLAKLLADKAAVGHCYHHRPCQQTHDMHLQMLQDFHDAMRTVTDDIEAELDRVRANGPS
jgi:hypothetical protein